MSSTFNPYQSNTGKPLVGGSGPVKAPGAYMALAITMIVLGSLGTLSDLACQVPSLVMIGFGGQLLDQMAAEADDQGIEVASEILKASAKYLPVLIGITIISFFINIFWIVAGVAGVRKKPAGRSFMITALILGGLIGLVSVGFGVFNSMEMSALQTRLMEERGIQNPNAGFENIGSFVGLGFRGLLVLFYGICIVYLMVSAKVRDFIASVSQA